VKEFQKIPGVGPSIAENLRSLGFRSLTELKGQDPEAMYESLCSLKGARVDRCMLYVFRCAVYFVTEETHDPELLKWWRWKDRAYNGMFFSQDAPQ
jgi:Pathogenicity locus